MASFIIMHIIVGSQNSTPDFAELVVMTFSYPFVDGIACPVAECSSCPLHCHASIGVVVKYAITQGSVH